MSDNAVEGGEAVDSSAPIEGEAPVGDAPEAEGAEVDWKAAARKWESRAKESFKRVQELEPLSERLSSLEEESRTKISEAEGRAQSVAAELAEATGRLLRMEVASDKGVPVDMLVGDSREALEASAEKLIEFRDKSLAKGNYAPSEGEFNRSGGQGEREFVSSLFS